MRMLAIVTAALSVCSTASAQEFGPYQQTCSYQDNAEPDVDAVSEVPCTMRYVTIGTGLRSTYRFAGRTVVVESVSDQSNGLWSAARVNGRAAVGLELYRDSRVYVTTDMGISFEVRGRGAPKYPAY